MSARPAPSQRRRARARRGRVADKDASWCVRATPRELSRGRRAARACASVPASASGVLRRGEGKEDSTSGARAMPSLQEMTAGKARLRNTPRAVRAPRRANPFRPSAPLRAPRVVPRPYLPARLAQKIAPPPRPRPGRDPSTPSNHRAAHLTSAPPSRLPHPSRAVRDDARQDPRHGGSPRRQG